MDEITRVRKSNSRYGFLFLWFLSMMLNLKIVINVGIVIVKQDILLI